VPARIQSYPYGCAPSNHQNKSIIKVFLYVIAKIFFDIFKKYGRLKKHLPAFVLAALFCVPFFFSYFFYQNKKNSVHLIYYFILYTITLSFFFFFFFYSDNCIMNYHSFQDEGLRTAGNLMDTEQCF
jgi:hypothetical protein